MDKPSIPFWFFSPLSTLISTLVNSILESILTGFIVVGQYRTSWVGHLSNFCEWRAWHTLLLILILTNKQFNDFWTNIFQKKWFSITVTSIKSLPKRQNRKTPEKVWINESVRSCPTNASFKGNYKSQE